MAVDTRDKRMAMIGLGSPVPRVLPDPDGGFGLEADRLMLLFLYPGFAIVIEVVICDFTLPVDNLLAYTLPVDNLLAYTMPVINLIAESLTVDSPLAYSVPVSNILDFTLVSDCCQ